MSELKRTRVGNFQIEDAVRLSKVEELMQSGTYEDYVMPPDSIFMEYESAVVKNNAENALLNGNKLCMEQLDFAHPVFFGMVTGFGCTMAAMRLRQFTHLSKVRGSSGL